MRGGEGSGNGGVGGNGMVGGRCGRNGSLMGNVECEGLVVGWGGFV